MNTSKPRVTNRPGDEWIMLGSSFMIAVAIFACAAFVAYDARKHHPSPGPEWAHDRGSIYWSCTDSGRALIRDVDTGSTFLDRDDRKCDSGG